LREVNGILLAAVAFGWLAEAPLAAERNRLGGISTGSSAAELSPAGRRSPRCTLGRLQGAQDDRTMFLVHN